MQNLKVWCTRSILVPGKHFACIFHDEKRLRTASGNGRVKNNFQTQTFINAVCHVYKHLAFETLIKSTPERKFGVLKKLL
ncbi:unnamed protein product [Staurois parvus]|uniref:Uncharacterized protein n=1 Tax=Staurois parvus TaxID=386267 RepID=A0ABN9B3P6_9NEOB|nr:unnamed protein product [Staurois parvus]